MAFGKGSGSCFGNLARRGRSVESVDFLKEVFGQGLHYKQNGLFVYRRKKLQDRRSSPCMVEAIICGPTVISVAFFLFPGRLLSENGPQGQRCIELRIRRQCAYDENISIYVQR